MPEIITFISPKGGSGASFCLSGVWSALMEKGHKVLAVDGCFEKCDLDYVLGFKSDYVYTMTDVTDGNCTPEEAMCTSGNGSFIRFDYENNFFEADKAFEILKNTDFDYILVDINDRDEDFVNEVLKYTQKLVMVTEPSNSAVKHCELWVDKFEPQNAFVLVNKIIPSYIKSGIHYTIDNILDNVSLPLVGLVPWSPDAEIAIAQGVKNGFGDDGLKTVFSNIADRICGLAVKAYDFKKVYDCFKLGKTFSVKVE